MASNEELQAAWIRFCNSSEAYGIDDDVDAAAKMIDDALDELAALRAWRERAVPLLRVMIDSSHKALRGPHFNCWYCGEQPFKYFEPGGILEAGWEHASDCAAMLARALLAESEAPHAG